MSKIWGIRFDDREFNIGDEISASHRFENGIDTGISIHTALAGCDVGKW